MSVALSPLLFAPLIYVAAVAAYPILRYIFTVIMEWLCIVLKFFGAPCVFLDWKHGNSIVSHCPCHDFSFPFSLFPIRFNTFELLASRFYVCILSDIHTYIDNSSRCDMQDIVWLRKILNALEFFFDLIIINGTKKIQRNPNNYLFKGPNSTLQ